jgi:hypothetical protein
MMPHQRSVFDTIARQGNDNGYRPHVTKDFEPTDAPAGSPEKIAVLRWRMERGLPLWHSRDLGGYWLGSEDDPLRRPISGHDAC